MMKMFIFWTQCHTLSAKVVQGKTFGNQQLSSNNILSWVMGWTFEFTCITYYILL